MKKILLFTFLIYINVLQTKAQSYYKLLNHSSWCESINAGFGQPINYYVYYQSNDTVINSLTYAKILVTGGGSTLYVREDTIAKKVYKLINVNSTEAILYNFSLNVGDTLDSSAVNTNFVVTNIDTVTTLAGQRRRFTLNDASGLDAYTIIESIGCTVEPFSSFIVGGDPVYNLVCSYQNNTQVYDGGLVGYTCYNRDNVPCDASFTYQPLGNGQVLFTNLHPGYSSHWTFGYNGGLDTTVFTPSVTITLPCNATFTVQSQVSMNSSGTDVCYSMPQLVSVTTATNSLHASYTYTIMPTGQILFTNTSTGIGNLSSNYYWSVYDTTNNLINSSNSFSPSFYLPKNHTYILTLSDMKYPCNSSYTDTIFNAVITTGVKIQQNNNAIRIFPNPNNGNFIIETGDIENQMMKIFDVTGKTVFSQYINAKANIDVSDLTDGMYFIEVKKQENIFTQKVIIQH